MFSYARPARSNRSASSTPSASASLAIVTTDGLRSPRSIPPMRFRWTPVASPSASYDNPRSEGSSFQFCFRNDRLESKNAY